MRKQIKNYGLNVEETLESLDSTQFLLGSTSKLGTDIIFPDGNHLPYIPTYEPQFRDGYDTFGCVVFGTLNAIETLMKRLNGKEYNFSERFIYILGHVRPPGSDPHKIIEIIRKTGLIPQEMLPMTTTYEEFIQPDPMTKEYIDEADKFLNEQGIGHEWIFANSPNTTDRISQLKWAMQRGTVCISVTAWYQDENGLYIDNGQQNTHWCELVDIEEKDGKFYPVIIDSYDLILNGVSTAFKKKLHPDHKMVMAKRYAILPTTPKLTETQKKGFLEILEDILRKIFFIQKEVDKLKEKEEAEANKPPVPVVATTPFPTTPPTPAPQPAPKYLWDTPQKARHSIRVICDEQGLSLANKNLICAVIQAESGFYNYKNGKPVVQKNFKKDGVTLSSTDWGICQINDTPGWHIGKGLSFASVEELLANPDKAVRFMISMHKVGKLTLWVAYNTGSYRKYL